MKLKLKSLYASLFLCGIFLFAGCSNATTSFYRSYDDYNTNSDYNMKRNSEKTTGRFFNWEDGIVTEDRYQNYSDNRPTL